MHPCCHSDASGIAAREESGSGRTADRCRSVVVREAEAFLGKLINAGGLNFGRTVATEIVVALVVDEDEDDVGLLRGRCRMQDAGLFFCFLFL